MPLRAAILAALPASMEQLATATGVRGQPLWDEVHAMRREQLISRTGPHTARIFTLYTEPAPKPQKPRPEKIKKKPIQAPRPVRLPKRLQKHPAIVFWMPGWPTTDPGRIMMWATYHSRDTSEAEADLKRLSASHGDLAQWALHHLTEREILRLRETGRLPSS